MSERKRPQAADKVAFLLALVPYLMDHERITVTEVGRHFDVEPEQIRDAVKLIATSGIPGETGTYQHSDLFDVAWGDFLDDDEIVLTNLVAIDDSPRFSGREAAALIAGLQYLSALPEHADRGAISSLMDKLSRGASAAPAQVAVADSETDATLAIIRSAVAAGTPVTFNYVNSRGESEPRTVDPLRVEWQGTEWYLRGWCHLRQAVRTFRLDRISNPAPSTEPLKRHRSEVVLPQVLFEGSAADIDVLLEITPAALPQLADYLGDNPVTEAPNGSLRGIIRVSDFAPLKRLVASMPRLVTVIEPPAARAAVAQWAAAGAKKYSRDHA